MKRIFIIIPEALTIRNILRSGTLDLLKKAGHRIYIFILCDQLPEYLKQEFLDEQVSLIAISEKQLRGSKIHKCFMLFTHFLILNDTTRAYFRYSRHYINRPRSEILFYYLLLNIFSRLGFLKSFARWVEDIFFKEKNKVIADYFTKRQPSLVFSTSITARLDNIFMKEAKRRGIKTVSMTKSWDNATKMYFRFVPDYFIVQNEIVKEKLSSLQDFPKEKVYVVGFPQFDWYARKEILRTREEHLKSKRLNPNLPVIFFGSQGVWYKEDYKIAEMIYSWIQNDELVKPCQMIVRPHFSNVKNTPLKKFRGLPMVAYDDSYHESSVFVDNWDPIIPEIIDFANTLKYSDVIVVMLSTIALDAACFNKPVIDTLFGGTFQRGRDVTGELAKVVHYQWVFRTHGTTAVRNFTELKEAINRYLLNPNLHFEGRQRIINELNYKVDGRSSERLVQALHEILEK